MNQAEASAAILNRWQATWSGLTGGVASSYDNIVVPQTLPRAAVNIISLDSDQATMGRRVKMLREGMIEVRLYGPPNVGRRQLDELAGHVRTVFERRKIGRSGAPTTQITRRVKTHAATVNELRRDRDSSEMWILSVTIPFEFWEISER